MIPYKQCPGNAVQAFLIVARQNVIPIPTKVEEGKIPPPVRVFRLSFCFYTFFFIRKIFKPKNLKMLRKSPVSNAWAAIFKNADFS